MFELVTSNENPSLLDRLISIFWAPKYESPVPRPQDVRISTPSSIPVDISTSGYSTQRVRARRRSPGPLGIRWLETCSDAGKWSLTYENSSGEIKTRVVEIIRTGYGEWGDEYFDAREGRKVKTFKKERVVSMERIL